MAPDFRFRSFVFLLLLMLPFSARGKNIINDTAPVKLYLEATLSNSTPYVGQEVLLTYTLFFNDIAPKISDTGKPEHTGLWVQEITPEGYIRSTPVVVNKISYRKAVVKQMKLVPMQSGRLMVSNYRLRCLLPLNHEISFDNQKDTEMVISGPEVALDAKPLPDPVPENFSGTVGSFTMTVSPEKSVIHVGEPLTLSITINGKGNLKTFPPVDVKLPEGFRQDEPDVATVIQEKAGKNIEAVSTNVIAIPEKQGVYRFSPVSLVYFDPFKQHYETIAAKEISVTVQPALASAGFVKTMEDSQSPPANPKDKLPAGITILALAFILLVLSIYAVGKQRKRRKKFPSESGVVPEIPHVSETQRSPEALRRYLFDSLKKSGIQNPGGMTAAQLKTALTDKKIPDDAGESLLQLLKKLDHAIYAPGSISPAELGVLYQKAANVLNTIAQD
jgi:hypothetical protein